MKLKPFQILKYCLRLCLLFMVAGCLPPGEPDLVPKSLSFDSDNILNVTFKNEGEGEVPANKGNLLIFIDGLSIGGYSLSNLADQSFRNTGGSLTIRTNFRMAGNNRRIAVFLDSTNEVDESNEFQNTLSRTLTPTLKNEPDFIISDLYLGSSNQLIIKVKNIGTANSPANLNVRIRVIVNESVAADLTPTLRSLTASGGETTITPNPAIVISANSNVRVLLNTNNLFDEIDNTNNVREKILPAGPSLAPYTALLSLPKIRNNIIWQGAGGVEPQLILDYSSWNASQKTELNNTILTLERNEPQALLSPPVLFTDDYISSEDAWDIYLSHIAQSLWIEVHNMVPWHLTEFTDEQLAYLLDSRKLLAYSGPTSNRYKFSQFHMGTVTAWNVRVCYEFLSNLQLIKSSQQETIYNLTAWMRGHLSHIFADEDLAEQFGYPGPPPVDKMLYPLEGKQHLAAGCWGTSGLYAAVLRSVNIPVVNERIYFDENTLHSRPFFPSIDKGLAHGDDVYSAYLTPSGAVIPTAELFYTSSEINGKFINPSVDCVSGDCNTISDQAAYNSSKDHIQLAYDYMTDYMLYQYAYFGGDYLNNSLRGPRRGGSVEEYVKPFFPEAERVTMVSAVENKVIEIGDGDLETGKNKVIERWNRFLQNK